MNKKYWARAFTKFLKDEGCYEKFKRNFSSIDGVDFRIQYLKGCHCPTVSHASLIGYINNLYDYREGDRYSPKFLFRDFINFAFSWEDSIENHDYWSKLNRLWLGEGMEYYKQITHAKKKN